METKLKAILMADICGFSRMVQENEAGTLADLVDLRDRVILPTIHAHDGAVANTAGDGFLAVFDTVASALDCSEAILLAAAAQAPQFRWRMGLHLADIVREGDTIHGHGVNIAARIEALAAPNGIVATQQVFDALSAASQSKFQKMGSRTLKNIANPVLLYRTKTAQGSAATFTGMRFALGFIAVATLISVVAALGWQSWSAQDANGPISRERAAMTAQPVVAVLPFHAVTDDEMTRGLEMALAREIITDLTRFSALKVLALSSTERLRDQTLVTVGEAVGARYVVSGNIQSLGNQVRIGVEVADAMSTDVIWSERFVDQVDTAFELQLEIAKRVASVVGQLDKGAGPVWDREWERAKQTKPQDMTAYQHYLVARNAAAKGQLFAARNAYAMSLDHDPDFGRAHAGLAWTYAEAYLGGRSATTALGTARDGSWRALNLSPYDNEVLQRHGAIQVLSGEQVAGVETLRRATEFNPGDADTLMWYGWGLTVLGRSEDALEVMQRAAALNPFAPAWYDWNVAWAHFLAGRSEETIRILKPLGLRRPNDHFLLAAAQARLGQVEEMSATADAFKRRFPDLGWNAMAAAQALVRVEDRQMLEAALSMTGIRRLSRHPLLPDPDP